MILVTGANGQLGQCFRQLATEFSLLDLHFAGSADLDVADKKAVTRFFKTNQVTCVINCAAYTAVDKAESEVVLARRINLGAVRNLAEACAATGATLIHFSTDYVYHGNRNTAFREEDPVHPAGVYARTKLAGERAALRAHPGGVMILRTSWVYSVFGNNFVKTMLRLGRERKELRVVADQIGSPTYAPDLARTVLELLQRVKQGELSAAALAGIWNYSNEGVASWYDFATAVFDLTNMACRVVPIESSEFPTPASRPPFSLMNKSKIKRAFGLDIPHWRESLSRCLAEREIV